MIPITALTQHTPDYRSGVTEPVITRKEPAIGLEGRGRNFRWFLVEPASVAIGSARAN